jgi:hypothetical protein
MAGIDSQSSVGSMNSDLDHSKVEHCFQEFYTEVNNLAWFFIMYI